MLHPVRGETSVAKNAHKTIKVAERRHIVFLTFSQFCKSRNVGRLTFKKINQNPSLDDKEKAFLILKSELNICTKIEFGIAITI